MIEEDLSKQILTIGCEWKKPKGGIAVVLNSYSKIFSQYNIIVNSNSRGVLAKILQLIWALIQCFFKFLFNRNIKIVHIHTASYNSFKRSAIFISFAKFFKKKVIIHVHGGGFKNYYETNRRYVYNKLLKCDVIIALTEHWKIFFRSIGFDNVVVIPNIIDEPLIKRSELGQGKLHILFLGLITQQKGIYDLIEVISQYRKKLEGKIIFHIGGNGEIDIITNLIKAHSLESIVQFHGWVSGDKKISLLNGADIFILPSYIEGLPISLLEAMSYRLPIISTTVGGIPEIIENGLNGILVTPGDKEALINAIKCLSEDKQARIKMGQLSYEYSLLHFPKNVAKELELLYLKLI